MGADRVLLTKVGEGRYRTDHHLDAVNWTELQACMGLCPLQKDLIGTYITTPMFDDSRKSRRLNQTTAQWAAWGR